MFEKYTVTVREGFGSELNLREETWEREGKVHRSYGPAYFETRTDTGVIVNEQYWFDGKMHRSEGPAYTVRDGNSGQILREEFYEDDRRHRDNGPALIEYCPLSGRVLAAQYWTNGQLQQKKVRPIGPNLIT